MKARAATAPQKAGTGSLALELSIGEHIQSPNRLQLFMENQTSSQKGYRTHVATAYYHSGNGPLTIFLPGRKASSARMEQCCHLLAARQSTTRKELTSTHGLTRCHVEPLNSTAIQYLLWQCLGGELIVSEYLHVTGTRLSASDALPQLIFTTTLQGRPYSMIVTLPKTKEKHQIKKLVQEQIIRSKAGIGTQVFHARLQ